MKSAAVLATVALLSFLTGCGENGSVRSVTTLEPARTTTTVEPGNMAVSIECPTSDPSPKRYTTFEDPPLDCLDPGTSYSAEFATSKGDFTVALDAEAAPLTVNNFVVLARYRFYDGIPFHRIVPDFVIQAGDPQPDPDGRGGPGYTIGEEPPADGQYEKYDIAMAKTAEPNSTGSQFFIVTGDPGPINYDPSYSLFGKVVAGQEAVDAIAAAQVEGPSGDRPVEKIVIESVTIVES